MKSYNVCNTTVVLAQNLFITVLNNGLETLGKLCTERQSHQKPQKSKNILLCHSGAATPQPGGSSEGALQKTIETRTQQQPAAT